MSQTTLAENGGTKTYRLSRRQIIYSYFKTVLDFLISLLALLLLSPILLAAAVAIKLDDGGPIFFRQKRVGKNQKLFMMTKFRTMRTEAPHDMPTHMLADANSRITRVGKFLRKSSIDELPQLFDCIRPGMPMSLIGPRPALWNQYDLIEEREKYGVYQVKPGLTGWAQINGRDEIEIPLKAKLDGEYVREYGIHMDLRCFFGSIGAVLGHRGVVEGGTGEIHKNETAKNKILIITNHSYMLWRFRKELVSELQKSGEVVISTPFVGHEDDFAAMGCRMIETKLDRRAINPFTDLKLYRFYKKLLRTEQPNMAITYSIKPNIYAGYACKKLCIPYCVNVQGLGTAFQKKQIAGIVTVMYRSALKKAKTVFFENEVNAQEFVCRKIMSQAQQTVLRGAGVNLEDYQPQPYPSETDGIHFLYIGRIMKEKGMDELFEAAQCLKKKYGDAVQFDLVGFFEDAYKTVVERLEAEGLVKFHGFQSDPKPFYAMCHCVILPSYHEGMSNVLLEAAATGRALITTDIPGCREAVKDGVTGFLCEVANSGSLKNAVERFIRLPCEERAKMGTLGREYMEAVFDKYSVVHKTVEKIQS